MKILKVRSDHGGEFENEPFESFCEKHGIIHEFFERLSSCLHSQVVLLVVK